MNRTVAVRGFGVCPLTFELERDEEPEVARGARAESFSGLSYFTSKSRDVSAASDVDAEKRGPGEDCCCDALG